MKRRHATIPVALAALFLTGAPVLLASPAAQAAAEEAGSEHENAAELQAFQQTKVSLLDALSAAEKQSGGKAMSASFEDRGGTSAFRVKTVQQGSVWEGRVNAASGQVLGQGKTTPQARLDQEDKAEITGFQQAKTSLAQAVKTAEKHAGGKALDAELESRGGSVVYDMEIAKNGGIQKVTVDPSTGQVVDGQPSSGSSARPSAKHR